MGNICSPSFSCDDTISHCLDCTVRRAGYITELQDNLNDLERDLRKLIAERNDVRTRVEVAERKPQMKRLERVQEWLSRVEDLETQAGRLTDQSHQQVEQLCLGSFCSKNCKSSYKLGAKVFKTLRVVQKLIVEGDFKDVAQTAPENPVDERPIPSVIIGLQPTFEKVWRCITEEQVGIIGIYGMGGVGKTTLLTQINNKFLNWPKIFDVVIWAVVSKDLEMEKIQESIAKRIGLFNESWKSRSLQEKAQDIFKILSKKKFVLLLDDIWEEVDLTKMGLPLPSTTNASKVIFTTRKNEVCGQMKAQKSFRVECLEYKDAWRLFEENVGRETLDSHPNVPALAETVAKECAGLPLALIVVARAMTFKKTPQEWEQAIEVLKASKFSDIEKKVFSPLKFSYDFLPGEKIRFCLLYCGLFPEDFLIEKEELIDFWICERFLDEYDGIKARNEGYTIIGSLVRACMLEEEDYNYVKMHDVIRDMALWISSTTEKEKEKFLVRAGVGLNQLPSSGEWEGVTRMSLMRNKIKNLSNSPACPLLQTLFLSRNKLKVVESDFFQSMTSLRVLDLACNRFVGVQLRISELVSLQYLNLSWNRIKKLPEELKYLVHLKCLNLEHTYNLSKISPQLISNLKMLRVLRMFCCGLGVQEEDSILFGGCELLVEELLCLEHLNVLTIDLRSFHAHQRLLSSPRLQSSSRSLRLKYLQDSKSFSVLSLASSRNLEYLEVFRCEDLEEFKIQYTGELKSIRETHSFHNLLQVYISSCSKLRHMTFLIFAPNLKRISISFCIAMEEIIKLDDIPIAAVENLSLFSRLQFLQLYQLDNLKIISSKALQFPHLKEMTVKKCPKLHKLPLDYNITSERKFIIKGGDRWWNDLQWENEATQSAFLPSFKSTGN